MGHIDYIALLTALLGIITGYYAKASKERYAHERATHISERDLMRRIDGLQAEIIKLTKENSELKAQIQALRTEVKTQRRIPFRGEDYAAGCD